MTDQTPALVEPPVAPTPAVAVPLVNLPPSPARTSAPVWVLPVVTGVLGVLVGAGGVTAGNAFQDRAGSSAAQAVLTEAVSTCELAGAPGIQLGDGGTTLTFDMQGEDESSGAGYLDIACIFAALEMPSNVSSHMDQTTSMDGRQAESWDDIAISWSYHPDRGLDGVLTMDVDE